MRQDSHRAGQHGHAVLLRRRRDPPLARRRGRRGRRPAGRSALGDPHRHRTQDRQPHRRTDPRRGDVADRRGRHSERRTGGPRRPPASGTAHRGDDRRRAAAAGKRRDRQLAEGGDARRDGGLAGPRLAPAVRLHGLPQRPRDEGCGMDERPVPHPREPARDGDQLGRRGRPHGAGLRRLGWRAHHFGRRRAARFHVRRGPVGGRQNLHRHPVDYPQGRIEDQGAADARRRRRDDPPHGAAHRDRIRRGH